jgi:hypothetical protein
MIPSEIEPATFRLVAQFLNQMRHRGPRHFQMELFVFDTVFYTEKNRMSHIKCDLIFYVCTKMIKNVTPCRYL